MTDSLATMEQPQVPVPKYDQLSSNFQDALCVVDDIVLKNYISKLNTLSVVPLNDTALAASLSEDVRFFKITEMVYEKDEFATYKFVSVFNALSSLSAAVFIIMDSNGEKTDFYMGIRSLNSDKSTVSLNETLQNAITGQFPGIKIDDTYMDEDMQRILSNVKTANISAVSCVANSKDSNSHDNRSFIQGLEKLALAMQGKRYTGIILANSTSQEQLSSIRRSYEEIYTQLIPFAKSQISYSSNNSMSVSESSSLGKSISTSITNTHGLTKTTGTSVSVGVSDSTSSPSIASKAVSGLAAASSILGAALAVPTGGASLAIGGVVSGGLGLLGTAIQRTDSHGTNRNEAQNESDSVNDSIAKGETAGETETKTDTRGITSGTGENITLNIENKVISNILDRLDTQLDRLQEFESLGMWECAAYFMSDDTPTDT